jgi:NAD(P)-dependent dehydrogenase (short-subunit alcohol dehydrogenase family)
MPRSESPVALVTGAARGIGAAVVAELADTGHRVAATHLTSDPPATLTDRALWLPCDVRRPEDVARVVQEVEGALGSIDVFVGNAAVLQDGMSFRMRDEQFLDVLDVDLRGNVRFTELVLDGMRERGFGRIVYVSSVGGITGSSSQANYATAKAALHGFARAIALEAAPDGVTVNVVAPGPIDTELMRGMGEKHFQAFTDVVPANRMGRPEEVAATIGFLISPAAAFITGVVLPIDGGLLLSDGFVRSNRERMLAARKRRQAEQDGATRR